MYVSFNFNSTIYVESISSFNNFLNDFNDSIVKFYNLSTPSIISNVVNISNK